MPSTGPTQSVLPGAPVMFSWNCVVNEAEKVMTAKERRWVGREGDIFDNLRKNIFVMMGIVQ